MIAWFARNGVAANLLMLLMVVGGIASLITVKRELFPQFSLDTIAISVPYPGASPEEIEESVVIRIEEAIEGLDGIKETRSVASENIGSVIVTVEKGYKLTEVKERVKSRVDAIITFPEDIERPIVDELLIDRDTIWVAVYGQADERSIKEVAEQVRDEIVALAGISQVEILGVREYELSIEVPEDVLRSYGLSFDSIVQSIRAGSMDLPGGLIRSQGGEIQLRTKEQRYTGEDFASIVVRQNPDGSSLLLEDIATIRDGFEESNIITKFDGKLCALLQVREVGQENPLKISDSVYDYVEYANQRWVPKGVEMVAWGDSSFYLKGRLELLINNGLIGFGLVLLSLAIFLRPSLAIFVSIGIPVSFLGTFALAPFIGLSINLISLFAFILVLGIVVDDAIVVGESVFTEFQSKGPSVESAISGTHRVSTPVTFAVVTTMVAFLPVFFLPGLIGKFFVSIPLVVIPTLAFSLVQSKLVLPYHLSLCKVGAKTGRDKLDPLSKLQRAISDALERFIRNVYGPFIQQVIGFRYLATTVFFCVLVLSVAIVVVGWVRFVQFPNVPSDFIVMELEMAEGTPIEETTKAALRIEKALYDLAEEEIQKTGFDPLKYVSSTIGYSIVGGGPGVSVFSSGSNVASMIIELSKSELRDSSAFEVSNRWRDMIGEIPGSRRLVFNASASGPVGLPVDIRLTGDDFDELQEASEIIQAKLREYEGLYDIRDTYAEGKREIKIRLKPNAEALGVTSSLVAQQVRSAFFGAEAQRIQRGKHDIKVMVRYPEADRKSLGNLQSMRIRTPDGREIPIGEVAELGLGYGFPSINRIDGQRVINIQADANKAIANTTEINAELYGTVLPELLEDYPGVVSVKDGEARDFEELLPALVGGIIMVLVMIYSLLAIPFKSYLQPLIVMFVVPFGISGAIIGHFLTNQDLSILSFLGIIALTGVVVNDSLVLVDYINRRRAEGMPLREAIHRGGMARFRAIMLTSITTFVGLVPILTERSLQAQFLIPMATSLSFGVLFATFITLILVPCSYMILEDLTRIWNMSFGKIVRLYRS
jgi:multidrug efflux pump subunit AcrB